VKELHFYDHVSHVKDALEQLAHQGYTVSLSRWSAEKTDEPTRQLSPVSTNPDDAYAFAGHEFSTIVYHGNDRYICRDHIKIRRGPID
jgi:hypothetical protein